MFKFTLHSEEGVSSRLIADAAGVANAAGEALDAGFVKFEVERVVGRCQPLTASGRLWAADVRSGVNAKFAELVWDGSQVGKLFMPQVPNVQKPLVDLEEGRRSARFFEELGAAMAGFDWEAL